jgi:uncharacterized protein
MSSAPFPERIDAVKMFARMGSITAELPLARLQRLSDQLSGKTGVVDVDVLFGTDEEGRRHLSGTLDARVQVACQRCLQDMELDLHCELSLLVFDTEDEVQELPESRDAVTMTEDGLDVVALIEDELILSLPMIPMHADVGCNRVLNALKQGEGPVAEERPNPFAILAGLKAGTADKAAEEAADKSDKAKKAKPTKAKPGKNV